MPRYITVRFALAAVLIAPLLPSVAFAWPQDSQSVAEAARRARQQKKPAAKPARVLTDDDVKHSAPANPAAPAPPAAPSAAQAPAPVPSASSASSAGEAANSSVAPAPAASAVPAPPLSSAADVAKPPAAPAPADAAIAPNSAASQDSKDTNAKEIAKLKEAIKQAQGDLELLRREQSLEQDKYYSNPDYVHNPAGKANLNGLKQQITDKQQELDGLKARLAALQPQQSNPGAPPSRP